MRRRDRAAHAPEFRLQVVWLDRSGRSLRDLAKEFAPSLDSIADRVDPGGAGLTCPALRIATFWPGPRPSDLYVRPGGPRPRPSLRVHQRAPSPIVHPHQGPHATGLDRRLLGLGALRAARAASWCGALALAATRRRASSVSCASQPPTHFRSPMRTKKYDPGGRRATSARSPAAPRA